MKISTKIEKLAQNLENTTVVNQFKASLLQNSFSEADYYYKCAIFKEAFNNTPYEGIFEIPSTLKLGFGIMDILKGIGKGVKWLIGLLLEAGGFGLKWVLHFFNLIIGKYGIGWLQDWVLGLHKNQNSVGKFASILSLKAGQMALWLLSLGLASGKKLSELLRYLGEITRTTNKKEDLLKLTKKISWSDLKNFEDFGQLWEQIQEIAGEDQPGGAEAVPAMA